MSLENSRKIDYNKRKVKSITLANSEKIESLVFLHEKIAENNGLGGQPSIMKADQDDLIIPKSTFANLLQSPNKPHMQVPLKEISYLHWESCIIWGEEKTNQMIIKEDLQYAVIGKFSYG